MIERTGHVGRGGRVYAGAYLQRLLHKEDDHYVIARYAAAHVPAVGGGAVDAVQGVFKWGHVRCFKEELEYVSGQFECIDADVAVWIVVGTHALAQGRRKRPLPYKSVPYAVEEDAVQGLVARVGWAKPHGRVGEQPAQVCGSCLHGTK